MRLRGSDSGFTVVELLIALSIISLVMVMLLSVLGYGRMAVSASRETQQQLEELALLRRVLSDALGQITARADGGPSIVGSGKVLVAVIAVPRLLSFLAPPVRLTLQPGAGAAGLVASWSSDSVPAKPIEHRVLADDREVRFSYFIPTIGWRESWTEPSRLPSAVRATIANSVDARRHADLEIPVRTLVNEVCATQPRAAPCGVGR
jgi:prepilin-type N-terminal cleavage/methylation domain-containing protein